MTSPLPLPLRRIFLVAAVALLVGLLLNSHPAIVADISGFLSSSFSTDVTAATTAMAPAVDIITLDNFAHKLPRWSHDDPSQLHALVDMGSNGIRFSISDLSPPRTRLLPCIYRERAGISLFDALTEVTEGDPSSMELPAATIELVAATLARFRRIALDDFGVTPDHMAVFATEAMRRAANAGTLLDAIAAQAPGLAVYVLAPEVETLFGSIGARAGFFSLGAAGDDADPKTGGLMLDLGGGSVQMTYVDPQLGPGYEVAAARAGQSMPYGAARLTRAAEAHRQADDITINATSKADADVKATTAAAPRLADDMTAALERLHGEFASLRALQSSQVSGKSEGIDIYLCGGGFRGYGSMLMHTDIIQPYPVPLMGGYRVDGETFKNTHGMRATNHELGTSSKVFGMSKRRRQQFAAITAVVDALVAALERNKHVRIRSVTFCQGGNREGALMMRLPEAVRESNPLRVLAAGPQDGDAIASVLRSALPAEAAKLHSTLPLISSHIWERLGVDTASNAAYVLHDAVVRDPSTPGLTHEARAILAVSLWTRWGGGVAPADVALLQGLRQLLGKESGDDLVFWAEYVGGVAAALAAVFPGLPSQKQLSSIKFTPTISTKKERRVVELGVQVAPARAVGLSGETIAACFDAVGKQHKDRLKVKVKVYVGEGGL
ncbi:retrograde regulation protein [Ophiostoma piceae UAMH 11346]|uniref:Retrograde regulation protein n=1 Tax=Ophiostoma piceae (strain UAMH 11346) TaxID=1262450 RepID=S3CVF1_OPHP1|nr:retrograde regulation protein [Ophiostoma piceae UAMH 11346]